MAKTTLAAAGYLVRSGPAPADESTILDKDRSAYKDNSNMRALLTITLDPLREGIMAPH